MNIFAHAHKGNFSLLHAQRRPREISSIDDDSSRLCTMHRYIYLLLLIALGGRGAYAQQSFSAPGGFTIAIGDSIQFGLPAPGESYASVFDRLSQERVELPSRFKDALPFSRAKVEGCKLFARDTTTSKLDTFLVLRHPRFPEDSLFLDLSWAVSSGEVLVSDPTHTLLYPEAKELTPDLYVPALLRAGYLSPGEEAKELHLDILSMMRGDSLDPDSLEYQRVVARIPRELQQVASTLDPAKVYYVSYPIVCAGYNTEYGGYPLADLYTGGLLGIAPRYPRVLFAIVFALQGYIPIIHVPAEVAKRYEERSRSVGSDVHSLTGRLYFRMVPVSKTTLSEVALTIPGMEIECLGLDLYEFAHCEYYHLGSGRAFTPDK